MKADAAVADPKPYHHGDLRRALLDSAGAILEREGPSALSLRAVAREAGVSSAAPYHHFKDKDELLNAIAKEGFAQLKQAMAKDAGAVADPRERVSALGVAYVQFAGRHPALYRVMYDCARDSAALPDTDDSNGAFLLVKSALAEAAGEGVRGTDIHLAAIATWCAIHGLAQMRGFAQLDMIKRRLGGEQQFLRGVLDHLGMFIRDSGG